MNINIKLDSVILAYLDSSNNKKNIELISDDKLSWKVPHEEKLDIRYYAFIVNNQFWICDSNCSQVVEKYGVYFSDYTAVKSKITPKIEVVKSMCCKDFYEKGLEPYLPTDIFTNLDPAICYWTQIKGITQDLLVIFQVIDPNECLYHMDHEWLLKNSETSLRHYYAGVKISPLLTPGQWTFRLIYRDHIVSEKKVNFKILRNSYNKESMYFFNQSSIKIDNKF